VPGAEERSPLIWDSEVDVTAALEHLRADPRVDGARLAVVGASYSGEEMAEAGRLHGYARAYVALSPGSFSDESVERIDASGVAWLFVVSRDEPHLREITAAVRAESRTVELVVLPGTEHGARLLAAHPDLAERIAVWLAARLHR
jgi:dienelactone hydrolase